LATVINIERAKPANCFRIGWDAKSEEGFFLELNHPTTYRAGEYIPALILGEGRYILRNRNRGCLYEVVDGRGLVRRAVVGEAYANGKPFPLLDRFDGDAHSALILVDLSAPQGLRVKGVPAFSGIAGGRKVSWGGREALVELKYDETLTIFYPDGRVCSVIAEQGTLQARSHAPSDAVETRLRQVVLDHAYDTIAPMIRMTKNHPELRKQIIDFLEGLETTLSAPVRKDLKTALHMVGDLTTYWWLVADADEEAANAAPAVNARTYDGRLHGLITKAIEFKTEWAWKMTFAALKTAADEGQLRPGVQNRFCTQCPSGFSELSDEVGKLPVFGHEQKSVPSPLGNKTTRSRKEEEARRAARRAERLALQPQKGRAGQKSEPNSGKGKKNGKK
jgi:hypothetical protein